MSNFPCTVWITAVKRIPRPLMTEFLYIPHRSSFVYDFSSVRIATNIVV
jgi:hypothetical protein